jgi:hypothetical protein
MLDRGPRHTVEKYPRRSGNKQSHNPIPKAGWEAALLEKINDVTPPRRIESFPNIELKEQSRRFASM